MHTNLTIIFNFKKNFVGHIKEKWQNAIAKRKLPQPTRRDWKALEILLGLKASFSKSNYKAKPQAPVVRKVDDER